ncbi:MAG: DUF4080 domain-containing protein [Campylobacteraceae bacterium]|nr:DUF4080 domain-containing protein [Campylobacteraceae bacterium]
MSGSIILTTFNARYTHTSIALRYLYANLHELQNDAHIMEFVINENIQTIAEKILAKNPRIVAVSTYIWNASDVKELIDTIKKVSPNTIVVLGGPEVSYFPIRVDFKNADYIVQGAGEKAFYELCGQILKGRAPKERIIKAARQNIKEIGLAYKYYTDEDIAHRYIYVEASRGCPFECEFCLSSIDERIEYFDTAKLLEEFETLWQRGARNFKFIDRTFNLNMKVANELLDFFLAKEPPYLLHFEVIPDSFPPRLKEKLKLFPPASLQLEVGIQTLNEEVAARINRNIDIEKIRQNVAFLENETHAHMHLDLIVGLPGESVESFGKNLNELCRLTKSEIQVGILKKLSGTTLARHDEEYGMIYSDTPPYDILQNNLISFGQMQKLKRFARFWDIAYNSGNFKETITLLWPNGDVFGAFYGFSEWIYEQTDSTWQISLNRFAKLLFEYLTKELKLDAQKVADFIVGDIARVEGRSLPAFLKEYASHIPEQHTKEGSKFGKRQQLWAK